jgi:hypothetical protein
MGKMLGASHTSKPKTRSEPVGSGSAWVSAGGGAGQAGGCLPVPSGLTHQRHFPFSSRAQPVQSKPQKVSRTGDIRAAGKRGLNLSYLPSSAQPWYPDGEQRTCQTSLGNWDCSRGLPHGSRTMHVCLSVCLPPSQQPVLLTRPHLVLPCPCMG